MAHTSIPSHYADTKLRWNTGCSVGAHSFLNSSIHLDIDYKPETFVRDDFTYFVQKEAKQKRCQMLI